MVKHNLVLLGPPGGGKGTQAKFLSAKLGIPHISTGDMFRAAVAEDSVLGRKVKSIIDAGNLVPDDVTSEVLSDRLKKKDAEKGFILDGYPRTLVQAGTLDRIMKAAGLKIRVIYFSISEDALLKRLLGRRTCPKCGKIYNIYTDNIPEGKCGVCNIELAQRADDNEKSVKTRFENYIKMTAPIIDYYRKSSSLSEIDASVSVEKINSELEKLL